MSTTVSDYRGYNRSIADTHSSNNFDFNRIEYNPTTGDYIVNFYPLPQVFETTTYKYKNSTLGSGSQFPNFSNNTNFTSYSASNPGPPNTGDVISELYLFKVGPSNTQINLTYTSFGLQINSPFPSRSAPYGRETFFVFGVPTLSAGVPMAGTATYSGIVSGSGMTPPSGILEAGLYDITGTSTLIANFSNATLTTSLTLTGSITFGTSGLVSGFSPTTATGTGSIGSPGFQNGVSAGGDAGTFYGTLDVGGNPSGSFTGRFYGPKAEEFGYNFSLRIGSSLAGGIAIGKQ